MKRIETGALQINDDWPGVFIRGDSALMAYVPALSLVLETTKNQPNLFMQHAILRNLVEILQSCENGSSNIQKIETKI